MYVNSADVVAITAAILLNNAIIELSMPYLNHANTMTASPQKRKHQNRNNNFKNKNNIYFLKSHQTFPND
jgi:hypothetical protein